MANAYSQLAQYNAPHSSVNLQLDAAVLGSLQKSYDANVAKVESVIEAYGNIPLMREEDKALLANNINTMLAEVNTYSKMDLTSSDTVRQIQQTVKGAITPYILEQSAQYNKWKKFEDTVIKKREKNDGTYNDANYQYALDKSNFQAYMNKEVDKLGDLTYYDYVDEGKTLRDEMFKYGKEYGFEVNHKTWDSGIEGVTLTQKGKSVSQETVKDFINLVVSSNPNLQRQMQINAHTAYRGYSDEDFRKIYEDSVTTLEKNSDAAKMSIEALRSNFAEGSPEYEAYSNQLQNIEAQKENFKAPLQGGNFNREAIQQYMYEQRTLNGYAKSYSYERWEEPKIDKTMFEVNRALRKDQEARDKAMGIGPDGLPLAAGTSYVVGLDGTDADGKLTPKGTALEEVSKGFDTTKNNLYSQLSVQYGENFTSLDEDGKQEFISALLEVQNDININEAPLSSDLLDSLSSFQVQRDKIWEYEKQVETYLRPIAVEQYKDMLKNTSSINLNNLSRLMPYTASILGQGAPAFEKLSKEQQKAVVGEIARLNKDNSSGEDADDWGVIERRSKRGLTEEYMPEPVDMNFFGGIREWARGTIGSLWYSDVNPLQQVGTALTGLRQGETAARAGEARRIENLNRNVSRVERGVERSFESLASWFTADESYYNLQADEIGGSRSAYEVQRGRMDAARQSLQPFKEDILSQTQFEVGKSFNPDSKADKIVVETINSMARTKGVTPSKNGVYNVTIGADGSYNVEVTHQSIKTENGKRIPTIEPRVLNFTASQTPEILKAQIRAERPSDAVGTRTYNYTIPKTVEDKTKTINNVVSSYGGEMPPQVLDNLYRGVGYSTQVEILQPYERFLTTPQAQQYAQELMNAKYSLRTSRLPSGTYVSELLVNEQPAGITSNKYYPNGIQNANNSLFAGLTATLTEDYIKTQLDKLRQ